MCQVRYEGVYVVSVIAYIVLWIIKKVKNRTALIITALYRVHEELVIMTHLVALRIGHTHVV